MRHRRLAASYSTAAHGGGEGASTSNLSVLRHVWSVIQSDKVINADGRAGNLATGGFMRRTSTILVSVLLVGNLNAASVPLPVPQAVQGAYVVSDMKQQHNDDRGKQHTVVDSGTLYALNSTGLYAELDTQVIENVVENGDIAPRHIPVFAVSKGSEVKQGSLYYLAKITAEKNGLVFNLYQPTQIKLKSNVRKISYVITSMPASTVEAEF